LNERTSYEQLIAEKAGQCSVPDMADAIWATIDAGLNEAPDDANNSSQSGNRGNTTVKFSQCRKLWLFAGSGIVLTAIVLIWLNYKSEKNKPENYPQQPKNQSSPVQPKMDSLQIDSVTAKKATHVYSLTAPTAVPLKADSAAVKKDTLAYLPPVSAPKIDSAQQHQQLIPDSSASAKPPRKQRGIKGITLDDYKIVPVNKDTGNNKN